MLVMNEGYKEKLIDIQDDDTMNFRISRLANNYLESEKSRLKIEKERDVLLAEKEKHDKIITDYEEYKRYAETRMENMEKYIVELEKIKAYADEKIPQMEQYAAELEKDKACTKEYTLQLEEQIKNLVDTDKEAQLKIENQEKQLEASKLLIESKEKQLEEILASKTWRLFAPLRWMIGKIFRS